MLFLLFDVGIAWLADHEVLLVLALARASLLTCGRLVSHRSVGSFS